MELVIKNIITEKDKKLFIDLAKRLGFGSTVLTREEKEDIALANAIDEAMKEGEATKKEIKSALKKWL